MLKCKVLCIISLFFLEKKSEICNAFTLFEKWKVNFVFLSLFSRMKSEMKIHWDRDREWKVKWKCLEIEIKKLNFQKNLKNSRETRLLQVTDMLTVQFWLNQLKFQVKLKYLLFHLLCLFILKCWQHRHCRPPAFCSRSREASCKGRRVGRWWR